MNINKFICVFALIGTFSCSLRKSPGHDDDGPQAGPSNGQTANESKSESENSERSAESNTFGLKVSKMAIGNKYGCAIESDQLLCWQLKNGGPVSLVDHRGLTSGSQIVRFVKTGGAANLSVNDSGVCIPSACYNFAFANDDDLVSEDMMPLGFKDEDGSLDGPIAIKDRVCGASKDKFKCRRGDSLTQIQIQNSEGTILNFNASENVTPVSNNGVMRNYCGMVNNKPKCFGNNEYGQNNIPNDLKFTTYFAVGQTHICGAEIQKLLCWGRNQFRQSEVPLDLGNIQDFAVGDDFTCALRVDGEMRCWGDLQSIGLVKSLKSVQRIAANRRSMCAVQMRQTVCWGYAGSTNIRLIAPIELSVPDQLVAVPDNLTPFCVVTNGNVSCQSFSRLWTSLMGEYPLVPDDINKGVMKFHFDRNARCALYSDKTLCWDSFCKSVSCTHELSIKANDVSSFSLKKDHYCAVVAGKAQCGMIDPKSPVVDAAVLPRGLEDAVQVITQVDFSCALKGGVLSCWGTSLTNVGSQAGIRSVNEDGIGIDASGRLVALATNVDSSRIISKEVSSFIGKSTYVRLKDGSIDTIFPFIPGSSEVKYRSIPVETTQVSPIGSSHLISCYLTPHGLRCLENHTKGRLY